MGCTTDQLPTTHKTMGLHYACCEVKSDVVRNASPDARITEPDTIFCSCHHVNYGSERVQWRGVVHSSQLTAMLGHGLLIFQREVLFQ